MRKKALSIILILVIAMSVVACGGKPSSPETGGDVTEESSSKEGNDSSSEKKDLVIMVTWPGDVNEAVEQMVKDKFGDKYNIIAKPMDANSVQTVKTAASANEQIDLVQHWPNRMDTFTSVDMATDLTPYVDEEWASQFNEGVLDAGTIDGKVYNIPYKSVYPAMLVDLEVTRGAGIDDSEITDQMSWETFKDLIQKITDNSDNYGAAIPQDYASWLPRNAFLQAWDTDEEMDKWNAGEISFKDEKIVAALDEVASVIEDGLFYPGEGALAVTLDQTYGALSAHKIGFVFLPTTNIKTAIDNSGIENYKIVDWPMMGDNPSQPICGSYDGYFIPSSSKNVEGAVEVLKYLTSDEVLTVRAEGGQVPTAMYSETANIDKAFMDTISRSNSTSLYPVEILNLDSELSNYIEKQMPANYIYNGPSALDELDDLRLAITAE